MIRVLCLETQTWFGFTADTPYEALNKMLYTLNLACYDKQAVIKMTKSGKCLYIEHKGKTYGVVNNRK